MVRRTSDNPAEDSPAQLGMARALMADALARLDRHSRSPAAAALDLALHHLDAEIARPRG